MELIQGKTYKIKRVQSAYYGRKRATVWVEAIYIGRNGNFCTFDLGEGRELDILASDIEEKVKEIGIIL